MNMPRFIMTHKKNHPKTIVSATEITLIKIGTKAITGTMPFQKYLICPQRVHIDT